MKLFASFLLGMSAQAAFACDPPVYTLEQAARVEKPVEIGAACEFVDSDAVSADGEWFLQRTIVGDPVVDHGNGKISQKLSQKGCGVTEHLLVIDCSAGEAVALLGAEDPSIDTDDYYESEQLIRFIQPPYGKFEVTGETSIPRLARMARRNGVVFVRDIPRLLDEDYFARDGRVFFFEVPDRDLGDDRYAISCGCQLYYPGSAGAMAEN
jgi:hypothetical protein